jgi:hypothetical protein
MIIKQRNKSLAYGTGGAEHGNGYREGRHVKTPLFI